MQHCLVPQQLTIKVKIKRFYTTPKVSFTRPSPRLSQVDQILIFCKSFLDWKTFRKFRSVHLVCCSLHNSANSQQKFKLRDFKGEIISICLAYAYKFLNMNIIPCQNWMMSSQCFTNSFEPETFYEVFKTVNS